MGPTKMLAFAGAATALITTTAATAADFPAMPPRVQPVVVETGGWYLRGDIGMTNQQVKKLDNVLFATTANLVIHDKNFESGMLYGLGFGYKWNNWLRFDVTGEYRGETGFHGFDTWTDGSANARFNNYTAKKSEWLVLVNAYLDLGTWWCITPFIGAGVGWSQVTIHSFRDAGTTGGGAAIPTMAYADAASKSNFAWALHAGLSYEVTKSFNVELAYRYTNLGNGVTGDIIGFDGSNTVVNPMHFKDITSHDVKLGVRWMLQPEPVYQPPLMRRG
ncbi:MAG: outer membrane beta-barrel protein [Xanthobacteraceae bacterium]|nr:outer membrane beta-barrel protein [Xanthobacteraceae bacterium]